MLTSGNLPVKAGTANARLAPCRVMLARLTRRLLA
jgi:hypothetical protein